MMLIVAVYTVFMMYHTMLRELSTIMVMWGGHKTFGDSLGGAGKHFGIFYIKYIYQYYGMAIEWLDCKKCSSIRGVGAANKFCTFAASVKCFTIREYFTPSPHPSHNCWQLLSLIIELQTVSPQVVNMYHQISRLLLCVHGIDCRCCSIIPCI